MHRSILAVILLGLVTVTLLPNRSIAAVLCEEATIPGTANCLDVTTFNELAHAMVGCYPMIDGRKNPACTPAQHPELNTCNPEKNPTAAGCNSASRRYCAATWPGFDGGFGPAEFAPNKSRGDGQLTWDGIAVVTCVAQGAATLIETNWDTLGLKNYVPRPEEPSALKPGDPECQSSDPGSTACRSAMQNFCRAKQEDRGAGEFASGFGPVEYNTSKVYAGCLPHGTVDVVKFSMTDTQNAFCQGDHCPCRAENLDAGVCKVAIRRACAMKAKCTCTQSDLSNDNCEPTFCSEPDIQSGRCETKYQRKNCTETSSPYVSGLGPVQANFTSSGGIVTGEQDPYEQTVFMNCFRNTWNPPVFTMANPDLTIREGNSDFIRLNIVPPLQNPSDVTIQFTTTTAQNKDFIVPDLDANQRVVLRLNPSAEKPMSTARFKVEAGLDEAQEGTELLHASIVKVSIGAVGTQPTTRISLVDATAGEPQSPDVNAYATRSATSLLEQKFPPNDGVNMAEWISAGVAMSWDGQFIMMTKSFEHWDVMCFRAGNVSHQPTVEEALANSLSAPYQFGADLPDLNLRNALAIVPRHHDVSGRPNPYRSNQSGQYRRHGDYLTYKAMLYTQKYCLPDTPGIDCQFDDTKLGFFNIDVVVKNPNLGNCSIESVVSTDNQFHVLKNKEDGNDIAGIEPTMTFDGQLLIYGKWHTGNHAYPLYSYNDDPSDPHGWSKPRSILRMYEDRHKPIKIFGSNVTTTLARRYPLFRQPIRLATGESLSESPYTDFVSAYPWVNLDGSELFYVGVITTNGPKGNEQITHSGYSTLGYGTNGMIRQIDGAANTNRQNRRLFTVSFGRNSSAWSPFSRTRTEPLPFSRAPYTYPFIGGTPNGPVGNESSVADIYFEVGFHEAVSQDYDVVFDMNEALMVQTAAPQVPKLEGSVVTTHDPKRVADISGNYHYGTLNHDAFFPEECQHTPGCPTTTPMHGPMAVSRQGVLGQIVVFKNKGAITVTPTSPVVESTITPPAKRKVLERYPDLGFSFLSFIQLPQNPAGAMDIAHKQGSFKVSLRSNRHVVCSFVTATSSGAASDEVETIESLQAIPLHKWVNIGCTYDRRRGRAYLYLDGHLDRSISVDKQGPVTVLDTSLVIGPNSTPSPPTDNHRVVLWMDKTLVASHALPESEILIQNYYRNRQDYLTKLKIPSGLNIDGIKPGQLPISLAAPNWDHVVALGKQLFTDSGISGTSIPISSEAGCLSCHLDSRFLQDTKTWPRFDALSSQTVARNTLSLSNVIFNSWYRWDGSASSLYEQSEELDRHMARIVRTARGATYRSSYAAAFGTNANDDGRISDRLKEALVSYQSTLLMANSDYDKYNLGILAALSEQQVKGLDLFFGKAKCGGCHNGSFFADGQTHDIGFLGRGADTGFHLRTLKASDRHRFRTPSLRNIAETAPYFHNGSHETLETVVDIYNEAPVDASPALSPLGLSAPEKSALVAFLRALSSEPKLERDFVDGLYLSLLRRPGSGSSFANYTSMMANAGGNTTICGTVAKLIANSPEAQSVGQSDYAFFTALHAAMLGRSASSSELATLNRLLSGSATRAQVVDGIAASAEFEARCAAMVAP